MGSISGVRVVELQPPFVVVLSSGQIERWFNLIEQIRFKKFKGLRIIKLCGILMLVIVGLRSLAPHLNATTPQLMQHVARGTVHSPFISLTRSFGVAWDYVFEKGRIRPTRRNPAYVYEVTLDPVPRGVSLLDPVMEVVGPLHSPPHFTGAVPYLHDGSQKFFIGIASHNVLAALSRRLLALPYRQPPPATGTPRPPNLTIELETIVRALRDTEVLVLGTIPASCITNRFDVYP